MAKTMNLGKVAMTTEGKYDPSQSYNRLTCVLHQGNSWVSRKEVPMGVEPTTDSEYWQLIAERGGAGPVGPQGNSAFDGTGVEIVNNLTQGGETAVLSAEQGKILGKSVDNFSDVLAIEEHDTDMTPQFLGYTYAFAETTVGNVSIPTGAYIGFRGGKFDVKAGENYILTGHGGDAYRLYCLVDGNNVIQQIAAPDAVLENHFIRVKSDGFLYVSCAASYDGYSLIKRKAVSNVISKIQKDISEFNISKDIKHYEEEDVTKFARNGYYTYSSLGIGSVTTVTYTDYNLYACIARRAKAGEKYLITGLGGGGARLYCLVDTEGKIKDIAASGEQKQGYELTVEEDGTLYCTFDKSAAFRLIRKYTDYKGWQKGSYEFGKGCDCNYTAPEIDGWVYPEVGQRVQAIYAWYDELLAEFPQYVSKENCDNAMAAYGIEKPEAIKNLPIYMYKFIPPKAPNTSGFSDTESDTKRIKALILTGTHYEYMGIWGCLNAMRQMCRNWKEDRNLEELRWNADIYIIPCFNPYGIDNGTRTNENAVDLNRNAPTADWIKLGEGTITYSGEQAGSEYSTKLLQHYLGSLKPQIFIDHHNTTVGAGSDEGDGKNLIYTHCVKQIGLDVAGVLISQMTRKWKIRYPDTFPSVESDNTLFGFTSFDDVPGSLAKYATEQGALGSIYECNRGILYKNGEYSTANRQHDTPLVATCATEGFVNYLVRMLKAYSDQIGVTE